MLSAFGFMATATTAPESDTIEAALRLKITKLEEDLRVACGAPEAKEGKDDAGRADCDESSDSGAPGALRWRTAERIHHCSVNMGHGRPDAEVFSRHITCADVGHHVSLDSFHFNTAAGQFQRLLDLSGRRVPGGLQGQVTGPLHVTAVDVYESPLARARYHATQTEFAAAGKPDGEVWVFHGTSKESAIDSIMVRRGGGEVCVCVYVCVLCVTQRETERDRER